MALSCESLIPSDIFPIPLVVRVARLATGVEELREPLSPFHTDTKGDMLTAGLFRHKSTAPIPNDDGSISEKPADKGLVVFILGANSNQ